MFCLVSKELEVFFTCSPTFSYWSSLQQQWFHVLCMNERGMKQLTRVWPKTVRCWCNGFVSGRKMIPYSWIIAHRLITLIKPAYLRPRRSQSVILNLKGSKHSEKRTQQTCHLVGFLLLDSLIVQSFEENIQHQDVVSVTGHLIQLIGKQHNQQQSVRLSNQGTTTAV